MTPHLSPLSHHKNSPKDLAQSFKALIYKLFSLEVAQADAQALHALEQSYGEFDFGGAIVCFTSAASSETLSSSSLGHTNLAFSLICSKPSATLSKSLYAKATQAINRAIPSYNIIFFLNPQEDLLTISFATRREHKRAADQDVLERVIIIKDLSLLSPSKGHLRNLDSMAKASKHKKQTPTPIDQLYQESIKALSIESLNEKFYQEVVQIFIALIDSIQLPTPSLRGEAEAIHKSKVDSSDEAMDCHAHQAARNDKKKVDSKKTAQNLNDSQAAGFADDFVGCQGVGEGIYLSGNEQAHAADSRKSAAKPTPKTQKVDSSSDNTKREFSLRLLSRLLFCKFLEKKGIIDTAIFSTTLSGNYYHEVLEPLFFSTLNTPKNARDYALLDPHIAALLEQIPYLNGGLFAPQASDFYSPSRPTAYHTTLKVPNAPLAELFTLLESYHFSIDESTPDAQEVGLNPELLGMVFESLLSELFTDNRKDSTSSLRKSTGSYYTPREIVQYMCRTSLYQYLLSKMDSAFGLESRISSPRLCDSHSRLISARGSKSHDSSSKILESTSSDKTAAQKSCREQTALESTFDNPTTNALSPSLRGSEATEAIHPTPSLRALREQSVAIHKSKVDSSVKVDCHADKSARNDSKNAANKKADSRNEAQNLSEQAQDSRICDEKSGLCEHSQGRALGVRNRRECEAIADLSRKAESTSDEAIHKLIFNQETTPYIKQHAQTILAALSTLKVLDPACGSGAFPIGLMQEILDLQDLLGDTRSPYTRKLEILQSNIYGIDIQPMATEISRLRCFLSLIVDESPHSIAPLPNLEFKFLSANSLLPLPQDSTLEYDGYQADKQKLESIRQDNFTADLKSREQLKQDYLKTAAHIARNLILHDQGETPLTLWNPYDPHSVAGFFDSEFMFGLQGFDIVIGNPPYISSENMPQVIKDNRHIFKTAHKKTDIYVFFYELAFKVLNPKGIVSYITSNKFLSQEYGLKLRELFLANTLHKIINFNINVFESANVDTCILIASKQSTPDNHIEVKDIYTRADYDSFTQNICESIRQEIFTTTDFYNFRLSLTDEKLAFLESIKAKSHALSDICFVSYGCRPCGNAKNPNLKKKDVIHQTPQGNAKPYIESKDTYLSPYTIHYHDYLDYQPSKFYNAMFEGLFTPTKLMCGRTLGDVRDINFVYDDKGRFCNDSMCCIVLWKDLESATHPTPKKLITKEKIALSKGYDLLFLQGVLNSKLIKFYVKELLHDGLHFYPDHQKQLPIPKLDSSNRHLYDQITELVRQILESKKQGKDTQELESKLDKIVYGLYDLNNDEIKIVEKG